MITTLTALQISLLPLDVSRHMGDLLAGMRSSLPSQKKPAQSCKRAHRSLASRTFHKAEATTTRTETRKRKQKQQHAKRTRERNVSAEKQPDRMRR